MGGTIYIFFPFSLFVSVYLYASVCEFVSIALLLPFVLGFCLSAFIFFYLKNFFLIIIFYFNNFILFYFILFYLLLSFFLFLPFILSRVEDRILVLQPASGLCH